MKGVYIQLRTDCNASCSICPQKKAYKKFGLEIMPIKLFEKIMSDLQDYKGILGLYLQFEPLLDERLFDFIKMAKAITATTVEISTNGILLKERGEKLKQSGIDRIYFNYGGIKYGGVPTSVIDDVNDFAKEFPVIINYPILKEENIGNLFPGLRIVKDWASNRGGNVDILHNHKNKFSSRNCQQLNIVASGDVILCCNDYMRENVFGNAKNDNVLNIWRNIPKHFDYPICRRCL